MTIHKLTSRKVATAGPGKYEGSSPNQVGNSCWLMASG